MAKPWRLTEFARRQLSDIAAWTVQNFGHAQAEAYRDKLISRCIEIAEGRAHSRPAKAVVARDLPDDLHLARCDSHLIAFIDREREVVITDFIHVRRDLETVFGASIGPLNDE